MSLYTLCPLYIRADQHCTETCRLYTFMNNQTHTHRVYYIHR